MSEKMRSEFEAWAAKDGFVIAEFKDNKYAYGATQIAWESWQASYKAALESAVKRCEEMNADGYEQGGTFADAIRQLGGE